METNFSVGGAGKSISVERPVVAQVSRETLRKESFSHIQSENDLKRAELSGEHIPISEEQLIRAIDRAIKAMQGVHTQLEFSVHEKTKEIMVKVRNVETGEIIREIPPEKTLDLVAKLWELAGILIDERI